MTPIERIDSLLSKAPGKIMLSMTETDIRGVLFEAKHEIQRYISVCASFQPQNKYHAGQRVLVGDGSISGIVERVIFLRNTTKPFYLVEWWKDGQVCQREFHEEDVAAA